MLYEVFYDMIVQCMYDYQGTCYPGIIVLLNVMEVFHDRVSGICMSICMHVYMYLCFREYVYSRYLYVCYRSDTRAWVLQ